MKKQKKVTRAKNNGGETRTPSASAAGNQDIVVLLTTLTQKLASFESKLDAVLRRLQAVPFVTAQQPRHYPPKPASPPERRRENRLMYKVICADCGKDSEVPFKPSADRPVFCKECFRIRRDKGDFKPRQDARPQVAPPVNINPPDKPKETPGPPKPEPARSKKSAAKKKKKKK